MSEKRFRAGSKGALEQGEPSAAGSGSRTRPEAQTGPPGQVALSESERSVRGRGGVRGPALRTIPENAKSLRRGDTGNLLKVDIVANYIQLSPAPNREWYMYRVDIAPECETRKLRCFLVKTGGRQLFGVEPVFDRANECRISKKIEQRVASVTLASSRDGNKTVYTVTFTYTGQVTNMASLLQLYNMQMNALLRELGFYQPQKGIYVYRDHFTPIGADIRMERGYRTATNLHEDNKVLMNLEGAHKLVQNKTVLQHMTAIRDMNRGGDLRQALDAEMTGKVVVAEYNKRVYRVEGIDFDQRPTSTFDRNGTPTTFIEYYRTAHNKTIIDHKQPLLRCVPNNQRNQDEAGREVLIVPELCYIAGLTGAQRAARTLKNDLIRASQVSPSQRVEHMRQFLSTFHSNLSVRNKLSEWGYSYATEPIKLKAYVLPATMVAYGAATQRPMNSWISPNVKTADISVSGLAVVPPLKKVALLTTSIDLKDKNMFVSIIEGGFRRVGLRVENWQYIDAQERDWPATYIRNIRNISADVDLAIVIMHTQNKERYDAIKKVASVEKGLITQVVTAFLMNDSRKANSAATKIAIQIAAKVGGEPWWADIPLKNTMVCGYDTYHDTAQRGRSYGAFLASMNNRFSRWWSKADAHDKKDEISGQVAANMIEAIKQYRKFNKNEFPQRVIIYRDGVGESQIVDVYTVELKRIQEALDSIGAPSKIKLTMIVVNKRIGARFYMRDKNSFANPPPGTVVDHTVTRQERFDFYLVSQSTKNGTVTPTYYNIIHDEYGFPPEVHQQMAYKFCLMYYNWSGTVRVPAPCQYAHKLALLCGEHLHAQPNATLDDKLHFL